MDSKRILLVEDDPDVARVLKLKLEHLGYAVLPIAKTADEAIAAATELAPDLIFMDIVLPGERDGIDAAAAIQHRQDVPIIYVTAFADKDLLARARITEPYGYVLKPVTERELDTVLTIAFYRVEVDRRLRRAAWLTDSLMSLCDPVVAVDRGGIVVASNRAAQTLFNCDESSLAGVTLVQHLGLVDADGAEQLPSMLQAALRFGETVFSEAPLTARAGGNEIPAMVGVSPIRTPGIAIVGAALVLRDVSNLARKDAERDRLLEQLREANVEMESFVYTISHDLKSPLLTIGGFADLLKKDLEAGRSDAVREGLGEIRRAASRMQELIAGLLNLSRAGRLLGATSAVDVGELVEDIVRGLATQVREARARIVVAPDLPTLRVDPQRFREAFECMVDNALRYRREGVAPRVEIGSQRDPLGVHLYVRDNGRGIAEEDQDRVFELFERADTESGGTGVGLSIARRVVEAHGGSMSLDSRRGHGSTFWVHLPADSWVGDAA